MSQAFTVYVFRNPLRIHNQIGLVSACVESEGGSSIFKKASLIKCVKSTWYCPKDKKKRT